MSLFLTRIYHLLLVTELFVFHVFGVPWKSIKNNVPKKFLDSPANYNLHNYEMLLNSPDLCNEAGTEEVFLLILVRSTAQHIERRQYIRSTWASIKEVRRNKLKIVFLFGNNTSQFNDIIQKEYAKYHDVLQESFPEAYKTLDLKTVMAWKWTITYCPNAVFVIVSNDEVFVDVFKTVSYLENIIKDNKHKMFYGCWMEREGISPNRNLKHKHGVSWKDYPGKHYPAFCNGNGYIASQQIIRKLYEMSLHTPAFMPDDVWTGVLSAKLNLVISNIRTEVLINPTPNLIENYKSFDLYAKLKVLLFPLDRKLSSCEVCVAHYLWSKIMDYNNPKIVSKEFIFQNKPNVSIFLFSFIINGIVLICSYFSMNKKILLLLIMGNVSLSVISYI